MAAEGLRNGAQIARMVVSNPERVAYNYCVLGCDTKSYFIKECDAEAGRSRLSFGGILVHSPELNDELTLPFPLAWALVPKVWARSLELRSTLLRQVV